MFDSATRDRSDLARDTATGVRKEHLVYVFHMEYQKHAPSPRRRVDRASGRMSDTGNSNLVQRSTTDGLPSGVFRLTGQDARPPNLSVAEAEAVALERFGIRGSASLQSGERDQTFRLSAEDGRAYVLKISNERENLAALAFQTGALLEVEARDPDLRVPRVCRSLDGHLVEVVQHDGRSKAVRLLTFLPGKPIACFERSSVLRAAVGATLARLDLALRDFSHPASSPAIMWNVAKAHELRPLLHSIDDRSLARLVEQIFDVSQGKTSQRIGSLRTQVIHNDFNTNNVLVCPDQPTRISGIIDFGDMLQTALIVDLAVSLARQVGPTDPIAEACEIVRAYHAVLALEEGELELLYDLACARLAMRLAVWVWRSKVSYVRFDVSHFDATRQTLETFTRAGRNRTTERFLAACRTPPV